MSWFSTRSFLILFIVVPMQLHAISRADDEVIYLCNKDKTPIYSDNPIVKHHCHLFEKEDFFDYSFSRYPPSSKVPKTTDTDQEDEALKQKKCKQAQDALAAMQKLEVQSGNQFKNHQLFDFYEKKVQQYCH